MTMEISAITVFAGLPVRSLDNAIAWYSQLFGRQPDGRPTPQIAEYYLAENKDPERGTLQLREDRDRAGGGLATINVKDISEVATALADLKLPFETQRLPVNADTVSAVTVGSFTDPDGNAVTVVQPHRKAKD